MANNGIEAQKTWRGSAIKQRPPGLSTRYISAMARLGSGSLVPGCFFLVGVDARADQIRRHDPFERCFRRDEEKPPQRNDPNQVTPVVHDVEVEHHFDVAIGLQLGDGLADRPTRSGARARSAQLVRARPLCRDRVDPRRRRSSA